MAKWIIEDDVPSTGLSKGAQKLTKGAEAVREGVPGALKWAGRNVARVASRVGEQLLANPFEPASLASGLGEIGIQAATGKSTPLENVYQHIPTQSTFKKYNPLPDFIKEPQNEYEQAIDDFVTTFVSLAGSPFKALRSSTTQALKLAGLGEGAKQLTKAAGLGEGSQEIAKVGTMIATSIAGAPRMQEYAGELYDTAKEAVKRPSGKISTSTRSKFTANSKGIQKAIKEVEHSLKSGTTNDAKVIAQEFLEEVKGKLDPVTKSIPLEEVAQIKHDINANIYKSSKKAEYEAASKYLQPLKSSLIDTVKKVGKKNPAFTNSLLSADEIYSAVKKQDLVSTFLQNAIRVDVNELKSPLTYALISGAAAIPASFIPGVGPYLAKGLASAAVGIPLYTGYKAIQVLKDSPKARAYYGKLIGSALKKNASQSREYLRKLDDLMAREDADETNPSTGWIIED